MNKHLSIAIDGPAAAGKSTVAREIAQQLKIVYIDTGAMYRALTLKAIETKTDLTDGKALAALLASSVIELQHEADQQSIMLDQKDVTDAIRSNDVTNHVSLVAQHAEIREKMVTRQQQLANNVSVVMDGRDIGTHVLPYAGVKIFLKASVKERALRRFKENEERGFAPDLEKLEAEIAARDERDINRESSPLVQAKDAIAIDTTAMSKEDVVQTILDHVTAHQNK